MVYLKKMAFKKIVGIVFLFLTGWQSITLINLFSSKGAKISSAVSQIRGASTSQETVLLVTIILLILFGIISFVFLKQQN